MKLEWRQPDHPIDLTASYDNMLLRVKELDDDGTPVMRLTIHTLRRDGTLVNVEVSTATTSAEHAASVMRDLGSQIAHLIQNAIGSEVPGE